MRDQEPLEYIYYFDYCNNSVRNICFCSPFIRGETETRWFSNLPNVIASQWQNDNLNSKLPGCKAFVYCSGRRMQ